MEGLRSSLPGVWLVVVCALAGACSSNDADGDGYTSDVDCDDGNPNVHPEAPETCNNVDDDCDGQVDNDPVDGVKWLADNDGDGFGAQYSACTMPSGITVVTRGGDCKDDNAMVFPGSTAIEVPHDGIDTDCDGNDFCTDLNCDGRPDVVVPSHNDGDYAVTQPARLLSGPGGWKLDPTPIDMSGTLGVAVFDLNDDGYLDIVHASYSDATGVNTDSFVYWGPNHGEASRTALPTHGAHWVCLGDLDGNGYTDIVFANNTDGSNDTDSYIYWNRGGAFSPIDRLALPTRGTTHCSVDDLDADGHPDIVFSNYASTPGYAVDSYIYWGDDKGAYSTAHRTDLPTIGSYSHTIADVDGDGRKDLVFWSHYDGASYTTSANYIYWNRATGFSATDRTALESMGGFGGAVADLNGDGHNEVIAPGYYAGAWTSMATSYIYWGDAANTYSSANRTALSLKGALNVVVDDINKDGHPDLLFSAHYDGDSFAPSAVFWGTAGGTYNDTNRTELPGYQVTWGAGVADFNHDGFKDVFLPGYHNNITGADMTPWANQAYSRIYWGSATGLSATFFDEWPTRGAWSAAIVGN
jgi:hypothetical protein